MNRWHILPGLLILAALSGCIYHEGPYTEPEEPMYPMNPERDSSYTLMEAVFIDGNKVGYTCTFLEVPPYSSEVTFFPEGSRFVKDLSFKNIGVITPHGKTYRYDEKNELKELCHLDIHKDLAILFDLPRGTVELKPLTK